MNAAARSLHQGCLFRGEYTLVSFSSNALLSFILAAFVLLSALGVVYLKNMDRTATSALQAEQHAANQLQVERGQLLLEQSTWATPARIQSIASNRLEMALPKTRQVTMVGL